MPEFLPPAKRVGLHYTRSQKCFIHRQEVTGPARLFLAEFLAELWSRGVTRWFRCGLSVAGPFVCRCLTSPSCSVSTPRSSNRTGTFRASGSRRKVHEVAHGKLLVRLVRRTKPNTSCKAASGNCWVAGQDTLCLLHSH